MVDRSSPEILAVVAIAGSLRRGSINKSLLRAAAGVAPSGMTISEHDLGDVPLYNYDVEQEGDPAGVVRLKEAIGSADGLLIVTPEYQHGMPGVLKNALDWASRPPRRSALQGKPVAVMGATPGMTGTARAQSQLRQTMVYNGCPVLPAPEVLVARAADRFDDDGRLTDEETQRYLADALERFSDWIRRFTPATATAGT